VVAVVSRILTFEDRAQIALGVRQDVTDRETAELLGRDQSIIWRERRRTSVKPGLHKPLTAHCVVPHTIVAARTLDWWTVTASWRHKCGRT